MAGAADDKKQGGNGNDPDEASKLKECADGLTKLAQDATKDNAKKGDTKTTKDSTGSSGSKKSCKHTIIPNPVDLCAQEMQKQTEEEDDAEEEEFAEAATNGGVSR
ncbi:hypothetical protein JMJ35_005345 [Cladonia borealis]|uniref:Uncharacterized protein n=1 Tax=Cladonia borealis TaxID=184061 RepID=A0AA39V1K9_9LECA|nr:hypothetical protein JMJ35_005345 [Cladonia borealis]